MKKLALLAGVMVFLGMNLLPVQAADYQHQVEAEDMSFAWRIDGDMLHGKMSAKTKGYVAVGFNPSKGMQDANFILGYVKNGKAEVVDHHGTRINAHADDRKQGGTQDVTLVGGTEENGMTTIEFTIPMNSPDELDGPLSADGDTMLLMAYGPDRDSFRMRHKYNGSMTVNLGTGETK